MKSADATVEIARIEARKTILSAVIGGLVTLATVMAGHWYANRGEAQPSGGTLSTTATPSVLEAPEIHFESKHIDWPLEQCMARATASLESSGLTGRTAQAYLAWGYQQQTTGLIWCHTDEDLAFFVAAGPDAEACALTVKELVRNF